MSDETFDQPLAEDNNLEGAEAAASSPADQVLADIRGTRESKVSELDAKIDQEKDPLIKGALIADKGRTIRTLKTAEDALAYQPTETRNLDTAKSTIEVKIADAQRAHAEDPNGLLPAKGLRELETSMQILNNTAQRVHVSQ